jgi:ubiquitin C-terminal hydrolase
MNIVEKYASDNIENIVKTLTQFFANIEKYVEIHDSDNIKKGSCQFKAILYAIKNQEGVKDHVRKLFNDNNSTLKMLSDKLKINNFNDILNTENIFRLVNQYIMDNFKPNSNLFLLESKTKYQNKLNFNDNFCEYGGNETLYALHQIFRIHIISFQYSDKDNTGLVAINGWYQDIGTLQLGFDFDQMKLDVDDKMYKYCIGLKNPIIYIIRYPIHYVNLVGIKKNIIKDMSSYFIYFYNYSKNDKLQDIFYAFDVFNKLKILNMHVMNKSDEWVQLKENKLIEYKVVYGNFVNPITEYEKNKKTITTIPQTKKNVEQSNNLLYFDSNKTISYNPTTLEIFDSKKNKMFKYNELFLINLTNKVSDKDIVDNYVIINLTLNDVVARGENIKNIYIKLNQNIYGFRLGFGLYPFENIKITKNINIYYFESLGFIDFILDYIIKFFGDLTIDYIKTFGVLNIKNKKKYDLQINNVVNSIGINFVRVFESNIDEFEFKTIRGYPNLGNTCYLNSVLNLLRSELLRYDKFESKIFQKLRSLVVYNQEENVDEFRMQNFVNELTKLISPDFKINCQQDAIQFLNIIFKQTSEEDIKKFWSFDRKVIINCSGDDGRFTQRDTKDKISYYLPLKYSKKNTIQNCINETLQFPSKCPKCQKDSTTTYRFEKFPNCYMFSKTFDELIKIKLEKEIELPEGDKKIKFKLKSISIRIGSEKSGHYTSIIEENNRWYSLNDDKVEEYKGNFDDIFWYLVLYQRIDKI